MSSTSDPLRLRLRRALTAAMKSRDTVAVAAVRTALGAIDNAEAVAPPPPGGSTGTPGRPVVGIGVTDVPRRVLDEAEVQQIVLAEIENWQSSAAAYERAGREGEARQLRGEAAVLRRVIDKG